MTVELPTLIEIEPTLNCNLRCRMCHVSYMPSEPRAVFDVDLVDRLSSLRGRYFVLGSSFEPMVHPRFVEMVRRMNRLDMRIELITNGTILHGEASDVLADARMETVTISFDGIRRESYEYIRRNANHAETLANVNAFRARFRDRATTFAANSTMMRCNHDELEEIADYWERADFDVVRYINMVVRESDPALVRESLYPVREQFFDRLDDLARDVIANRRKISISNPHFATASPVRDEFPGNVVAGVVSSDNPRARRIPFVRKETQLGRWEEMWFPCKSPWTFARIMANGDVQLCYQFVIGNLNEKPFDDIWFGEEAERIRTMVRTERKHCTTCDYYRLCINSSTRSTDSTEDYIAGNLLDGLSIELVNFENGELPVIEKVEPPRLIESFGDYNIVSYRNRYIGLPQSLGPVDLETSDLDALPGVATGETIQQARRRIRECQQEPLVALETAG